MGRISLERSLRISSGVALAALLALLAASPAVSAGASGTARYHFSVGVAAYDGVGDVVGGRFPGKCVGISNWDGNMHSEDQTLSTSNAPTGKLSLTIHGHGTSGSGYARVDLHSTLKATYRLTTACETIEGVESETAFQETPCAGPVDSKMHVSVRISGGVGNRVKLVWDFLQFGGASGALVPDSLCVEPLKFPTGVCTTYATLNQFNHKLVTLPFKCFNSTPPLRTGSTDSRNQGSLLLKRTG